MANYLFFSYICTRFFSEKNHLYLYITRYAREKWVNMAWYLHEKELGLNNKEQDIFMDKKIKALFFDIDGTLVSFKTHRIPQSTVDALEQSLSLINISEPTRLLSISYAGF